MPGSSPEGHRFEPCLRYHSKPLESLLISGAFLGGEVGLVGPWGQSGAVMAGAQRNSEGMARAYALRGILA